MSDNTFSSQEELVEHSTFKNEEDLIKHFKDQIERYKTKYGADAPDSILNISINTWSRPNFINFEFNFSAILTKLGITEKDEKNRLVCPYSVDISNVNFSQGVDFSRTTFSQRFHLRNIIFSQDVEFEGIIFSQNVNFNNIVFNKKACFNYTTFSQGFDFNYTIFEQKISFYNTIFEQKIGFIGAFFSQNVDFWETIFSQDIEFAFTTFKQNITFHNTSFEQKALFRHVKLEQKISFDNIIMNTDKSTLIFNDIYYDDTTKKFLEAPELSTIAIINTVIDKRIDFNNVHIAKLNLQGSNVTGILNRINLKVESENWETACILKNEELKRNNTIKALEYQAEEKKLYTKHLHDNKTWSNLLDRFSLLLGKIVNNHGQSWGRAIAFTLWVWVFSFTIFYLPNDLFGNIVILGVTLGILLFCFRKIFSEKFLLCTFYIFSIGILAIAPMLFLREGSFDFWEYIKKMIEYFVPTNYTSLTDSYITNESIDWWVKHFGIVVYMIGKIFIPYGVYEVIKAFRKYR